MRQHSTTCCWREGWTSSIRSSLDHQLLASSSSTRPKLSGTSCMKELPNMASTAAAALHLYKTCYVRINSYQNLNWVLFHGFIPSLWFQALHHIILVIVYVYTILLKQLPHSSPLPMSYMGRVTPEPFFPPCPWGSFASDTNSATGCFAFYNRFCGSSSQPLLYRQRGLQNSALRQHGQWGTSVIQSVQGAIAESDFRWDPSHGCCMESCDSSLLFRLRIHTLWTQAQHMD